MTGPLMRVLGPTAYLSTALALAWTAAVWGAVARTEDMSPVAPIPWVGN